jgi:hypothetical protein
MVTFNDDLFVVWLALLTLGLWLMLSLFVCQAFVAVYWFLPTPLVL